MYLLSAPRLYSGGGQFILLPLYPLCHYHNDDNLSPVVNRPFSVSNRAGLLPKLQTLLFYCSSHNVIQNIWEFSTPRHSRGRSSHSGECTPLNCRIKKNRTFPGKRIIYITGMRNAAEESNTIKEPEEERGTTPDGDSSAVLTQETWFRSWKHNFPSAFPVSKELVIASGKAF